MDAEQGRTDCPRCRVLEQRVAALEAQVHQLLAQLEEAHRAGKRQAAPFRKAEGPKRKPKKPGRKSGKDYGRHAERAVPPQIDEEYHAPLPKECPQCGGRRLKQTELVSQFQTEIPRKPIYRQFHVHVGTCCDCGQRVQGRHALQTSDALGAAQSQLGADAHAALAVLNKELGLSHGKGARLFERMFGIKIARATSVRSIFRTAKRCNAAYQDIRQEIRKSPWVVPDETGWRVGGKSAWLHVHVGPRATCYTIDPSRDASVTIDLLGIDWGGDMIHDGWAPYSQFMAAWHQQCLAHPMRRAKELLESAVGAAKLFPRQAIDLLKDSLAWRDRHADEDLSLPQCERAYKRFTDRLEGLVRRPKANVANQRFATHLANHLFEWFYFVLKPGIDATNWRAEQALRPAVVNRKVWGGNRTWPGTRPQSILTSVLVTIAQRGADVLNWLAAVLRSPAPLPLPP